jgi:uncharacterized protein (TIGR02246 family)
MEAHEIAASILQNLQSGWNNANGNEFAASFADISEFVDITGTLHQNQSPSAIGQAHQGLFMSIYKDSKVAYDLVQAIKIDQGTVLANAKTTLDAPTGPMAGKKGSTITMVLTNSEGAWKIRAFQNTLVMER